MENRHENAVAELYFHTLKTDLVRFEDYKTRKESRRSIFKHIEVFCNRERRYLALNYVSVISEENN